MNQNPMSGVLQEAWATYKAHAAHLISLAAIVFVIAAVLEWIFAGLLGVVGALLAAIVSIIATFLAQAALVKAADDVRDGRADMSVSDTLQKARPYVGRVAIASILAGIAIAIGIVLVIVPGLFLLTIWCLIVPVIVIENSSAGASFSRSRAIVKGFGWQVFGTLVLIFVVLFVFGIIVGIILTALPDSLANSISNLISGVLVGPYLAVVLTSGYYRLVAAHSGQASAPDPGYPPIV